MTFDDVAVHDGGVAGVQFCRNMKSFFEIIEFAGVNLSDNEPILLEIHAPVSAAASSGRFVNGDFRTARCMTPAAAGGQDDSKEQHSVDKFLHGRILHIRWVIWRA